MWANGAFGYLSDYLWWYVGLASLIVHAWCFFRFFPKNRPRLRLIAGNTLIGVCMLAVAGLVGETYLVCSNATDAHGASLTAKRWFKIYPRLNSLYCRDKEWVQPKPPGIYRIAFVGDSFTYGWGINEVSDRFTDLLQRRFDERAPGAVEVMNVAWVGWSTRNHLRAIRDMIEQYDVDEVVLCYLPNDIEPLLPISESFNPKEAAKSRYVNIESSFLLDFIFYRIYAPRLPQARGYCDWLWEGYTDPEIWRQHEADLDRIVELTASSQVKLRAALFPLIRAWGKHYDAARLQDQLAGFFASRRISTVELLPLMANHDPAQLVVSHADPHPNELAHNIFAHALWRTFYDLRE